MDFSEYFKRIKNKIEQSNEYTLRPDFKVTENNLEIGRVETKPYSDDFIDAYAQTVTYGLLLSALSANKKIDKHNFVEFLPKSLSIL